MVVPGDGGERFSETSHDRLSPFRAEPSAFGLLVLPRFTNPLRQGRSTLSFRHLRGSLGNSPGLATLRSD
ncbi:MAG TPA: hypothetical protein DCQ98_08960 [Planctomycetaceae bacterium]|nr:hypothetical protein [Planctomycetaceae bacterium]